MIRILIDGYNLMFASNLIGRGRGPGWLGKARERMLRFISQNIDPKIVPYVVVVFDAKDGKKYETSETGSNVQASQSFGLQVEFAVEEPEADDLIEKLISQHSSAKNLIVVSSDQRVRRKAIARRATALSSDEFLTLLEQGRHPFQAQTQSQTLADDEPDEHTMSPREVEEWMREFLE